MLPKLDILGILLLPSLVLNDKSINSIKVPPELTDLLQFHSNLAESVRFERFLQNWRISKGNPPDLTEVPSKVANEWTVY